MGNKNIDFRQAALEHLDALYGFAMVLSRNQTEAEDLVQETYLRAMRAFGQLVPDSNLKSWLFTIMRNIWRNQIRHMRSGPQFIEIGSDEIQEQSLSYINPEQDPHMLLVRKVEQELVRKAIEQLPEHFREIVLLRDIENFSYQQIANILECPAGTVMSRLARARTQLNVLLNQWQSLAVQK